MVGVKTELTDAFSGVFNAFWRVSAIDQALGKFLSWNQANSPLWDHFTRDEFERSSFLGENQQGFRLDAKRLSHLRRDKHVAFAIHVN